MFDPSKLIQQNTNIFGYTQNPNPNQSRVDTEKNYILFQINSKSTIEEKKKKATEFLKSHESSYNNKIGLRTTLNDDLNTIDYGLTIVNKIKNATTFAEGIGHFNELKNDPHYTKYIEGISFNSQGFVLDNQTSDKFTIANTMSKKMEAKKLRLEKTLTRLEEDISFYLELKEYCGEILTSLETTKKMPEVTTQPAQAKPPAAQPLKKPQANAALNNAKKQHFPKPPQKPKKQDTAAMVFDEFTKKLYADEIGQEHTEGKTKIWTGISNGYEVRYELKPDGTLIKKMRPENTKKIWATTAKIRNKDLATYYANAPDASSRMLAIEISSKEAYVVDNQDGTYTDEEYPDITLIADGTGGYIDINESSYYRSKGAFAGQEEDEEEPQTYIAERYDHKLKKWVRVRTKE